MTRLSVRGIVSRNSWCLAWVAITLGIAIIASHVESGRARWAAAAWKVAQQVPGSLASWGVVILLAGLLIVIGQRHGIAWRLIGLSTGFVWFCILAAATVDALWIDQHDGPPNTTNPLSTIAWLCFAAMYCLQVRDELRAWPSH